MLHAAIATHSAMPRRLLTLQPVAVCCGAAWLAAGCAAPDAATERSVNFLCDNGERVALRFFPQQGVGVLVRGGRTLELQQQPAASGFVYSNGTHTVRGKGEDLVIEVGRMVPLRCKVG